MFTSEDGVLHVITGEDPDQSGKIVFFSKIAWSESESDYAFY